MSLDSASRSAPPSCLHPAWMLIAWLAAAAILAVALPELFWLLLAAIAGAMLVFAAFRFAVTFSAAWLLIAGATLEMSLGDALGGNAYQTIIALVKAVEVGLACVCMLRYGARADPFNPAYVYVVIAALGAATGLHTDLSPADSLRSLIGSAAPLLFGFSRLSRAWAEAILRLCRLIPVLTVLAGGILFTAGLRPLFVDSGGWPHSATQPSSAASA